MSESIEKLRNALAEIRAIRSTLTQTTYETLVNTLLEQIQRHRQPELVERTESVTSDEIRLVTVMFVDVVESTRMAQRMDRGDWKNLISDAHALMATIILEADGNVGQYLGDGMLCYFGAQHSRSDDALRAVNCAVTIEKRLKQYAEEAMRRYKMATGFTVRISLSTGRVVVGMIGNEDKQELLALGPATNLAARLQTFAEPQTIVIDAQTQRRVRSHFNLVPHEPVAIKGFEDLVAYYTVKDKIETLYTDFTNNQIVGRNIPYIGRKTETKHILDLWWESQVKKQLQAVSIMGEIGIGKSRLLQQITETISQETITHIEMFADYERREASHNLLRNLLTTQCNLSEDTPPDEARDRIKAYIQSTWDHEDAEAVGNVLGVMYTSDQMVDRASERVRRTGHLGQRMIFSWVARWFEGMAKTSPLLIIVDNLQWIDPLSVELLEHLVFTLKNHSGMILGAGRSDMKYNNAGYMMSIQRHITLTLQPLNQTETMQLIEKVLHDVRQLNTSVIESIAKRANGNPLFVREFLSILFDNGVISKKGDYYHFNMIPYYTTLSELPGGLTGVLQARLDELPTPARMIIQAASVVGQRFWSGVVSEMIDTRIDAYLEELIQRNIILENAESTFEGEREFQFRHNLYQEVAYGMLPRAQREAHHSVVTRWMVTRMAGKQEYFPMLAEQFARSSQHEAALFTYMEAVQNRLARGLLEETLSLIESGLAQATYVSSDVSLPITSRLWMHRAQTYNELNRFKEATDAAESAMQLLDELPDNQLNTVRVEVARVLGLAHRSMGDYKEAFRALTRAHELIPEHDAWLLSTILWSFGSLALYNGRLEESLAYQKRAYDYASKVSEAHELNRYMNELGLIAREQGKIATALDYFEQVLISNNKRENIHYQVLDLRNIGSTYLSIFAYERALDAFERANKLQDYIQMNDALLKAYQGMALIEQGNIDDGMSHIEQAVKRGHQDIYNNLQIQLLYIEGLARTDQHQQALQQLESFLSSSQVLNPVLYGRGLYWKGRIYRQTDVELAKSLLMEALECELTYAGNYTWRLYIALADIETNPIKQQSHYQYAYNILIQRGDELSPRQILYETYLQSDTIKQLQEHLSKNIH